MTCHINLSKSSSLVVFQGLRMAYGRSDWRAHGRGQRPQIGVGRLYLQSALDDCSRLVYSEIHDDERGTTAMAPMSRIGSPLGDVMSVRKSFAEFRSVPSQSPERRSGDWISLGTLRVLSNDVLRRTRPARDVENGGVRPVTASASAAASAPQVAAQGK